MCELLSFFCCSSSSSSSSSSSCSSSFLSHVHFQFVTNFVGFALRLQRLKRPLGGHVLAFSLSLCRCTQTISVTYPVPVPAPAPASVPVLLPAGGLLAMLASFWTLFTVDFLHNFAAWLPVSGPRQFCSSPSLLPHPIPYTSKSVCVCVCHWHAKNMLWL